MKEVKRYKYAIDSYELRGYGSEIVLADFVLASKFDELRALCELMQGVVNAASIFVSDREGDFVDTELEDESYDALSIAVEEYRAALNPSSSMTSPAQSGEIDPPTYVNARNQESVK